MCSIVTPLYTITHSGDLGGSKTIPDVTFKTWDVLVNKATLDAGDSWGKAIGKGLIATATSFAGAVGGGIAGAAFGAAIPGADLTGIPELVGAILGAGAGGFAGGKFGDAIANAWLGP
jgi:hypothetical protein